MGFDINAKRIAKLKQGKDLTREVSVEELAAALSELVMISARLEIDTRNVFALAVCMVARSSMWHPELAVALIKARPHHR